MRIYNFSKVVGSTTNVSLLKGSLERGVLPKFIILEGLPGTGKSTCAQITSLSLTCDNQMVGEPCLECKSCKDGMQALKDGGATRSLKVVNLGKKDTASNINNLITEMFGLETFGNKVYILEEAHSLSKQEQTALLEEIDKNSDAYIIMCTTKVYSLLPELRSRARVFRFSRLNYQESAMLLDRLCESTNVIVEEKIKKIMIKASKGIPRDLTKLLDFATKNKLSLFEISDYLGDVNFETITHLFKTFKMSPELFRDSLEGLLSSRSVEMLVNALKDYVFDAVCYSESGMSDTLSPDDKRFIKENLNYIKLKELSEILVGLPSSASESDFRMAMLKIKFIVAGKAVHEIITHNAENAIIETKIDEELYAETVEAGQQESVFEDSKISAIDLMNMDLDSI